MHKSVFIFLSLFMVSFSASYAQWTWLNPQPSGNNCSKIIFTDTSKGFILNNNGDLIRTTDQGANWNYQQNFSGAVILDIKDSTGVVCGNFGTMYISVDNGNSWLRKKTSFTDNIFKADIVSRDTIFVASSNGKIFRSDDRGATWKGFNCGIQIGSIEFVNSKVGYIGGTYSYILKTEDGGTTWQKIVTVNTIPSSTLAIKFLDANNGFAFRTHSDLLSTKDGGQTWTKYYMGDDIFSFYFIDKITGFACGEYGVTYRTDDGGVTWKWISYTGRIDADDLYSTYFLNSDIGFTVGSRGRILKTTDGGTSWNTYSVNYTDISDISIPTPNTAYATVGNKIIKTVDSGKSWKQLALTVGTNYGEYDAFQTCHFFNADTGIVTASDYARVYKTYDGGETWKEIRVSQYGYDNVNCLQFLNKETGFLVLGTYSGSQIAKTTDGGETWSNSWSAQYAGEVFKKVYFIDEKTGYASRYERLFKTEDSAKTWKELWREDYNDISAIFFTTPQTGFVAGESGMIKKTNDGGNTWTNIKINSQYYYDINNLKFINEQVGYLYDEYGAVYKTTNGGDTWQLNGSLNRMNAIKFSPDSAVYLAGQNGAIMRSETSSIQPTPCTQNEWTGNAGTAWENPANWSCGTIPGANTNVTISQGAVVTINSYVIINTLTINPAASLSIGSTYSMVILH